jgi:predicted ATPase with chaperone activity
MSLLADADSTLRSKISGPLLDRIDIHIEVPAVKYKELRGDVEVGSSASVRERVLRAAKFKPNAMPAKRKSIRIRRCRRS